MSETAGAVTRKAGPSAQATYTTGNATTPAASLPDRIRTGDRSAEVELVQRYGRGLRMLLERRVKDPELARDLFQETFRIVISRLREAPLEDPSRLSSYMQKTAVNIAIGEFRKQQRRWTALDTGGPGADARPHSPLADLTREERSSAVRRLIEQLNVARDRELLLRHYVFETDKAALCAAYGLTPEHFDRVIYRARQRLKALIKAEGLDGNGG
ncbi:MAG TPA: sigma-70 family RNA polymerase sigma factor [Xanthomonadaceae bacterium]|nr:sigma-70 family RNA polymerase sigma factor [Xanthomonadaceae bacterium]